MSVDREPVLLAINNGFERRYFYSARQATRGLGWLVWKDSPSVGKAGIVPGEVQVYRLDIEATDTLQQALHTVPRDHDPKTGNWLKATTQRFQTIIQNCTGIKEK